MTVQKNQLIQTVFFTNFILNMGNTACTSNMGCTSNPLDLALKEEPGAMNVLHWFTSVDMKTWTHQGPIAWGVTSLGAHQMDDQRLGITCIQEVRPPNWWEQQNPKVYGYLFDGETFEATTWSIDDSQTQSYIDPQWFEGHMWYISPTGYTGDPAHAPSTPLRSSNPGIEHFAAPKISDPSIVRYQDEQWIFLTQNGSLLLLKGENPKTYLDPEYTKHFNGSTVPFAFVSDGILYLAAQRQFNGRRIPMISHLNQFNKWSGWKPITDMPMSIQACTSPIVQPNPKGGWVMMCIEEKRK